MAIDGIQAWKPIDLQLLQSASIQKVDQPKPGEFQNVLMEGIKDLNNRQIESNQMIQDFLQGNGPALHTVMLTSEKAAVNLEFAVQMRNKVMEAYQEIMRMQV